MLYKNLAIMILSVMFFMPIVASVTSQTALAADTKEFVEKPKGLLEGSEKASGAVSMINWILSGICVIASVIFLVTGASRINSGNYVAGFGSIVAAVVAAIAAYLVNSFIS